MSRIPPKTLDDIQREIEQAKRDEQSRMYGWLATLTDIQAAAHYLLYEKDDIALVWQFIRAINEEDWRKIHEWAELERAKY